MLQWQLLFFKHLKCDYFHFRFNSNIKSGQILLWIFKWKILLKFQSPIIKWFVSNKLHLSVFSIWNRFRVLFHQNRAMCFPRIEMPAIVFSFVWIRWYSRFCLWRFDRPKDNWITFEKGKFFFSFVWIRWHSRSMSWTSRRRRRHPDEVWVGKIVFSFVWIRWHSRSTSWTSRRRRRHPDEVWVGTRPRG